MEGQANNEAAEPFGQLLRRHRRARGLTQEQLAERSGLSVYAISMLERGTRTAPRGRTVESLARALELDAPERDALVAAAQPGRRKPAPRRHALRLDVAAWPVWRLSLPRPDLRLAALAVTGGLAVVAVGAGVAVWLGAVGRHGGPPVANLPLPPPPPSAVAYFDAGNLRQLRRIGYDGSAVPGTWSTTDTPVLSTAVDIQQVVGISPDGEHAVTLGRGRVNWRIVDPGDQIVTTVLGDDFGSWAPDSRHVCRMASADPLQWQVAVADVSDPAASPLVVPVAHLTYPPYITVAACDPAGGRVVLIEPETDTVPAPPHAERRALVVDLTTGDIVTRVPIGDATHAAVFSLDGRYVATTDYDRGTSSIVSLVTGRTLSVRKGEIRAFSGDDTRIVENSRFEPPGSKLGTTRVVDWRSGRVLDAQDGWTERVRAQPGGAALALKVLRPVPAGAQSSPTDLVIVPAAGIAILVHGALLF
jgi:transcriptional regulator with XRE-family HTH domain